ncbi:MAG: DUF4124 domain-containing protein [Thiogranum sp.]
MMNVFCKCLLIALLLSGQLSVHAEVYRWVDEKGQVHFGDQAREASTRAIKPHSSPPTHGNQQQRMQKTRKLLNAYQIERQQAREQKAKQKEQAEKRKKDCIQARDNLRNYTNYGNIYNLGEDGKREYLSEQERAALVQRSRETVARLCSNP